MWQQLFCTCIYQVPLSNVKESKEKETMIKLVYVLPNVSARVYYSCVTFYCCDNLNLIIGTPKLQLKVTKNIIMSLQVSYKVVNMTLHIQVH